jgi:predicted TIM-barrel fold metal-dependent hydrolase
MLPLFDSLAHPTLSGGWPGRSLDASFAALEAELNDAGYAGACAIGLHAVEGYSHAEFMACCRRSPKLIPIAGFDPRTDASPAALRSIRTLGFRGIKIHPRFSGLTHQLSTLRNVLRWAGDADLTVFYCTYLHCEAAHYPLQDPLYALADLLASAPRTRVVLVHGGDINLLRYAELVRFNPRLLLDLSMTMMKYEGSSVDLDINFLFRRFDRRICIGTDWPEYRHEHVRSRFEQFAQGLDQERRINIASHNLTTFLGIAK